MFARHPLDRLVSAYNDRLVFGRKQKSYRVRLAEIVELVRPDLRGIPASEVKLSLTDIIKFLQAGGQSIHYEGPYADLCYPCMLEYDYIGKVETFSHDINFLIDKQFPPGRGKMVHQNQHQSTYDIETYGGYHKMLPLFDNVSDTLRAFVITKYKLDFQMFGYKWQRKDHHIYASCHGDCC